MSKKERLIETLKDLLVFVLLVVLVCLCAIYMLSYQGRDRYDFTREQMEAISGETARYQYLDELDAAYCLPEVVAVCDSRWGKFGFFYGENLLIVNESFLRFYEKLFTEEGSMEHLSAEEGERLFAEAMTGDYLYASYFCDLPKSVICGMSDINTEGMSGESIREIFIVPEEFLGETTIYGPLQLHSITAHYRFSAIARDSVGNYYRYTTSFTPEEPDDISFNQNFYFAYSTLEGAAAYDLAALLDEDTFMSTNGFSEKAMDTSMIWRSNVSVTLPVLAVEDDVDSFSEYLEKLRINPEKVSSYTDETGTRFYFDGGRNVIVTPNSVMTYVAPDGEGISMSDLFGSSFEETELDVLDYLGAAVVMANSLESIKNENEEAAYSLFLSSFSYDGEILTVSFGYRARGLAVCLGGDANVLSFEFYQGHIRRVTYRLQTVTETTQSAAVPQMLWSIRTMLNNVTSDCRFSYAYVASGKDARAQVIGRFVK